MVDVKFANNAKPQLEIDFGPMKEVNEDKIIGYFLANEKVVSEKKREEMLSVILELIGEYDDICYVERITDDFIEIVPSDPEIGPATFKIFMSTTTEKPEGTGTKPESDIFMKHLCIAIQKVTGDVFQITSMEDNLAYHSKGLFPIPLDHGEVAEEERTYFSVEDYQKKPEEIFEISKTLPCTNSPVEKEDK